MNRQELIKQIRDKKTFLCIGLDPDIEKLPPHLPKTAEGVKSFCSKIIQSTLDDCVSYKLNLAFFESLGWEGMKIFSELIQEIPTTHFIIADAKRGDIGNTSSMYAKAYFETMPCDAITIAPYMGEDSIKPFLGFNDKWAIVLGLTSNQGSKDFELLDFQGEMLYEKVLQTCSSWGNMENMMFVVGATQPDHMRRIREILPNHFLLIPGIGAQGGSLEEVCNKLMIDDIGILVNSSREIIYASLDVDFAEAASIRAKEWSLKMRQFIQS